MTADIRCVLRMLAGAMAAVALGGCAITPVQPWEKGILARPAMSFEGNRLEATYDEHILFSKEASAGGAGVGGGGCGCN